MNDVLSQLLQLGPGIAAGATGNGSGMQAFMESYQRTMQMLDQQERDTLLMGQQQQDRQRTITRQDQADQVAEGERRRRNAMQLPAVGQSLAEAGAASETTQGAEQAIDALYSIMAPELGGLEQLGGLRDSAIQQAGRTITARQKRQVSEFVEAALKTSYVADNPEADPEITNLPEHVQKVIGKPSAKLSELQQFAQLPVGKPAKPQEKPAPFTLSPGATRYDGQGRPIATAPERPPKPGDGTPDQIFVVRDGKVIPIAKGTALPGDVPYSPRTQNDARPIGSGDAADIAEFNTALDDVATLRETLKGNKATGTSAAIGAALPNAVTEMTGWGTDAKQKNAVIARVKQVIGKALEGGVLRKEDESKYAKILPTIGDTPEVVATKLDGLERAIRQRQQRKLESLADAGYDTSRFSARTPAAAPTAEPSTPNTGPKIGERRSFDGTLAEWDGKGWKRVSQ